MDYEKKYKEALTWMQSLYDGLHGATKKDAEHYFPELKESEDERMWKLIKKYAHYNISDMALEADHITREQLETWLVKQGEQDPYNGVSVKYNGHTWGMCARDNGVDILLDRQLIKHLEKQGEQKQDPCDNCKDIMLNCHNFPCTKKRAFKQGKSVFDIINEEKVDNANKVEAKFKIGDWISGYYTNYKVLSVNNDGYLVEDVDGNKINILFENEKFHHSFTIADAKDGDVLLSPSTPEGDKECPFIFKEIDKSGIVRFYAALLQSEELKITDGITNVMGYANAGYHTPATKEQREQLKKAMADAGYRWSQDKKKMEKIEQKPVEDRYMEGYLNGTNDALKTLKPAAWSEEDELYIRELESLVKQVWATAEHKNDKDTIHKMSDLSFFLKTLKPQSTWKLRIVRIIEKKNKVMKVKEESFWKFIVACLRTGNKELTEKLVKQNRK